VDGSGGVRGDRLDHGADGALENHRLTHLDGAVVPAAGEGDELMVRRLIVIVRIWGFEPQTAHSSFCPISS